MAAPYSLLSIKWKISDLDPIFEQFVYIRRQKKFDYKIITTELDPWAKGVATAISMATMTPHFDRYFVF